MVHASLKRPGVLRALVSSLIAVGMVSGIVAIAHHDAPLSWAGAFVVGLVVGVIHGVFDFLTRRLEYSLHLLGVKLDDLKETVDTVRTRQAEIVRYVGMRPRQPDYQLDSNGIPYFAARQPTVEFGGLQASADGNVDVEEDI